MQDTLVNTDVLDLVALADQLELFIQEVIPDAKSVTKYGGTLFTLRPEEKEGQFCGVFIYRQHVQMSFSHGAALEDKMKLLKGSGKRRRHINYSSAEEVDFNALEKLLIQSSSF